MTRDHDTGAWGKQVRFLDLDGKEVDLNIPMSMFGAQLGALLELLLKNGLRISSTRSDSKHLARYIQESKTAARAVLVTQSGWHGDAAYSTSSRTPFRSDGGQQSTVMADTVPR